VRKKTVEDVEVDGKRVLVRADLNEPLDENGNLADDVRIRASIPTIKYLIERGARVVVASHLGRPSGKPVPGLRLDPVAERLSELMGRKVPKLDDCVGEEVEARVAELAPGDVVLLENTRFHPGETENDPEFAKALARLGDVFVNDAFGAVHRNHASTAGVARYLPAVAGLLLRKELEVLEKALREPKRPLLAIIGGAKVSDKIGILESLLDKVDTMIIGGGMANTFFLARGLNVGKSLVEPNKAEMARNLMKKYESNGVKLLLPTDVVVAERFSAAARNKVVPVEKIPDGWTVMDIGPQSRRDFREVINRAQTILWNGPMGVFEMEPFAEGTMTMAQYLAESGASVVVGGGESAAAVRRAGYAHRMMHISTGGGASLRFLEGKELPGVSCLLDKE